MKFSLASFLCLAAASVKADGHGSADYGPPVANVQAVSYGSSEFNLTGFVSMPEKEGPVPAVVIIPDWDGVNEYEQQRATIIAQNLGYVGFAADIYGADYVANGVPNDMRGVLAGKYRTQEPASFMQRIKAAVETVKEMPEVDSTKIALAGYCFGGSGVLMYALDDSDVNDDVVAIVSLHGGLGEHIWDHREKTASESISTANADDARPRVLVLSGGEDDMATDIQTLEETMDNATLSWEITRYSGIYHAWTVWDGRNYNELADHRSWDSMVQFLKEAFGDIEFAPEPPSAINVENVTYTDDTDGKALQGYLAKPDENKWQTGPAPAVVVFPNWDGVNAYEKERATLLAEAGYVAFAADIYGADLQEGLDGPTRREQSSLYRTDKVTLFISRMQRAIDLVQSFDFVDSENVAIIGYCFGGTGVVQYAFSGRDDVKIVAAYHGNVEEKYIPLVETSIVPYTMVLSGGEDDAHGNQTFLEQELNANQADWEISRYSGVFHGFTEWESDRYNLNADVRSWSAMMSAMEEFMPKPVAVSEASPPSSAARFSLIGLVAVVTSFLWI